MAERLLEEGCRVIFARHPPPRSSEGPALGLQCPVLGESPCCLHEGVAAATDLPILSTRHAGRPADGTLRAP